VYRVLIVDDEEPVLDSYEFMLKGAEDFALAGKARSGYEALKLIYETAPDLVFMDINIPGMDGLSVIAEVHEKFSSTVFILSTAYERFDLAQRAIPLGVFDYLVKPVSKKTFYSALDKIRDHLEKAEQKKPADAGAAGGDERIFLRETIGENLTEAEWGRCRERFSLPSDRGMFLAVEAPGDGGGPEAAGGPETAGGPVKNREKAGWGNPSWGETLREKLSRRYLVLADIGQSRAVFFISGDAGGEGLAKELKKWWEEIFPGSDPLWGMGGVYRWPDLYRSREEALAELGGKLRGADADLRERLGIARLRRRIGIGDEGEVKRLFTRLWEDLFASRNFDLARIKMISVFMFLLDDLRGSWGASPEAEPLFNPAEEILALEGMAAWETWVSAAFEKVQREFALRRSGNFPLPLVKAISFIHEHYAGAIQLGSVAEAAQVTPAYLSRLFSEYLKTNFVDYLTEFRLEKGEKLIRESGKSIKEIAFEAGYQDPNYFSKIFRKYRGQSPTEFAEEARKAGILNLTTDLTDKRENI
jgi:two-component system response regulator YesN